MSDLMDIAVYLLIFGAGFAFQAVLPGNLRMILIYPLAFVLGFLTHTLNNFLLLTFALGMTSRAAIGGYWTCVILELICLAAGFSVSLFI